MTNRKTIAHGLHSSFAIEHFTFTLTLPHEIITAKTHIATLDLPKA